MIAWLSRYFKDIRQGRGFDMLFEPYLEWKYGSLVRYYRQRGEPLPPGLAGLPNRLARRRRHVKWLAPVWGVSMIAGYREWGPGQTLWLVVGLALLATIGYLLYLDAYDGPLARKLDAVTNEGAELDADSDKEAALATYATLMAMAPFLFGRLGLAFVAVALLRGGLDWRLVWIRRQQSSVASQTINLGGRPLAVKSGPSGKYKFFLDSVCMLAASVASVIQVYFGQGLVLLAISMVSLTGACYYAPRSIREHQRDLKTAKSHLRSLSSSTTS